MNSISQHATEISEKFTVDKYNQLSRRPDVTEASVESSRFAHEKVVFSGKARLSRVHTISWKKEGQAYGGRVIGMATGGKPFSVRCDANLEVHLCLH